MARVALILTEIASYSLLLRVFGIPLSLGPSLYAGAVIVGLYLADFAGLLQSASMAIHLGGIAACIVLAIYSARSFAWTSIRFRSIPIAVCAVAVVLGAILGNFVLNENAKFWRTDEFSHWGTIIRAIYETDTFHFNPNPLYFQDYPPGAALFSYHLLQFLGYSEGGAMFSCSLLTLCLGFGVVGLSARLGIIAFLTVSWTFYVSVGVFGHGWSSVLIDHILAAAFASPVIAYLSLRKDFSRAIFVIPILVSATVLMKQSGFMLAIVAASICVIDLIILRYASRDRPDPGRRFPLSRSDIAWAIAMFASPVLISLSWRTYVSWAGLTVGWGVYSPIGVIPNILGCCQTSREIEIASKFFAQAFNVQPSAQIAGSLWAFLADAAGKFSLANIVDDQTRIAPLVAATALLLAGLVIGGLAPQRRDKVRTFALTGILTIGFLGYAATLLVAYLYSFSDYEARVLISFNRYLHVYILAWILMNLTMAMLVLRCSATAVRAVVVLTAAAIAGMSAWNWPYPASLRTADAYWPPARAIETVKRLTPPAAPYRIDVASVTDKVRPLIPKNAKVYLIWRGSNGLHVSIVTYELLPRLVSTKCWSVGEPVSADDMYTCKLSREAFVQLLAGKDYVVAGKGLRDLIREYPDLFVGPAEDSTRDWAQKDQGLFKIEGSGPNMILRHVPAGF